MPRLGDYIGHLLSEVTNARVQADLESVRIAEIYASHPLLRNMPVPHFRLPNVDLDVPVAISDMETVEDAETTDRVLNNMRESFSRVLDFHVKSANFEISEKDKDRLESELDKKVLLLRKPSIKKAVSKVSEKEKLARQLSVTTISDEMISAAVKVIEPKAKKEVGGPERLQKMKMELNKAVLMEFSKYLHENTRLNVFATSSELKEITREAEPRSIVVTLRLSITEEAFEWSVAESEGEARALLVPE